MAVVVAPLAVPRGRPLKPFSQLAVEGAVEHGLKTVIALAPYCVRNFKA